MKKISRRQFLKYSAAAAGGVLVAYNKLAEAMNGNIYLPLINKENATPTSTPTLEPTVTPTSEPTVIPPPTGSRVVQVHDTDATYWDYETGWYGDYVNQNVINNMVDEGLKQLTGQTSVIYAWQSLLPEYSPGKAIAIKVNFNNSTCNDSDNSIDALIEPVNAVVKGLKSIGVQEEDVWVYDAIRPIPTRFSSRCAYSGIQFWGTAGCGTSTATFNSNSPDAFVNFDPPSGITMPIIKITDVLVNATYLINMPILKNHGNPGVTLTFKNHFGTINKPADLHDYIVLNSSFYNPNYNPLIDIYKNTNILNKAILTIGDGSFGSSKYNATPARWSTFSNLAPNSLFFSNDPVAIDCVMFDYISAEMTILEGADDYLRLAGNASLGVYEHGDPWGIGYSKFDFIKISL